MGIGKKSGLLHLLLYFSIGILVVLVIVIVINSTSQNRREEGIPDTISSAEIRFTFYNMAENRKLFEFWAAEEYLDEDSELGRTYMHQVRIQIHPRDNLDQTLLFQADRGYRERGDHDFFFSGNCHIWSEDLEISSRDLFLENRNFLRTDTPVAVRVKDLQGNARHGMEYNINNNLIRLKGFTGILRHRNRQYAISGNEVIIRKGDIHKVSLQGRVSVVEGQSRLTADIVTLVYFDDFKTPKLVRARGRVDLLRVQENGSGGKTTTLKGEHQVLRFNRKGEPLFLAVERNSRLHLLDNHTETRTQSREIRIHFHPDRETISRIRLEGDARVRNRGDHVFELDAQIILTRHDQKGNIKFCRGITGCRFEMEEFKSRADQLSYHLGKDSFSISSPNLQKTGNAASLEYRSSFFTSPAFTVDTRQKILTSKRGIKSVVRFEQENLLFRNEDVFIFSNQVEIRESSDEIRYLEDVRVQQQNTRLEAQELIVRNNNRMIARQDIILQVPRNNGDLHIAGQILEFSIPERGLKIQNQALFRQGSSLVKAREINIGISPADEIQELTADDPQKILFQRENIRGESRKMLWDYPSSMVRFLQDALIVKDNVRTRGEEILLNLNTNDLDIISPGKDRSTTIIERPAAGPLPPLGAGLRNSAKLQLFPLFPYL